MQAIVARAPCVDRESQFIVESPAPEGAWSTVVEYTRYKIVSNQQHDFEQAYRKAQEYLTNSPDCDAYELTHCHEDRERYVLRIEWTSIEDHEQRFRHDPDFKDFLALVRPFYSEYRRNAALRTHRRRGNGPRRTARGIAGASSLRTAKVREFPKRGWRRCRPLALPVRIAIH